MAAVDRVVPTWAYLLYPYILDKDFGFGQLSLEVVSGEHLQVLTT